MRITDARENSSETSESTKFFLYIFNLKLELLSSGSASLAYFIDYCFLTKLKIQNKLKPWVLSIVYTQLCTHRNISSASIRPPNPPASPTVASSVKECIKPLHASAYYTDDIEYVSNLFHHSIPLLFSF